MKLNLGAADRSFPGYVSVDRVPPADMVADLDLPWPWPDSSVDEVLACDVIEHLRDRIHTMNELHRVLKPRGIARIEVPDAAAGAGFFQDPTHSSAWCMNSWQYFEAGSFAHQRLAAAYGIRAAFRVVHLSKAQVPDVHDPVWKITAVLEAVK